MSTTTSLTPSKKRSKVVHVVLLTGEDCLIYVDVKSKFQEVFNQVATHLNLREVEYFGLAFKKENEFQFVALDEKIHKQSPKKWKTCQGEGYDSQNRPILTVWFRVHFYVDQVVLLREKVTRHLYYLQLKENVLNYNNLNSEEKCFQMVGHALQADYGTLTPERHTDNYFDPKQYFPSWIIEKRGVDFIKQNTPQIHKDNRNLTRSDAELKYIKEASVIPSAHNLHFYRVKKKKTDKLWNTWLAVCPRGIEIYEEVDDRFRNLISIFLWPDIGRLYFDKKKFEIRAVGCPDGRKFTYYTDSDVTSKYLLTICRATHIFQMDIQPKLMEIRHLDAEDKRRYRESYIYSDARDLVANGNWIQHRPVKLSPSKSGSSSGNQRYSVVSDVSSNTTSGIVSDKMTISFDDSDADHNKEILIDSPPGSGSSTTPSTPRSKFAHIINSFHNYKKSASSNPSPVLSPHSVELYKPRSPGVTHPPPLSPINTPGSYRSKLQQSAPMPIYPARNTGFVLHSPPALIKADVEKTSRPVSRNVSRKESLKNQMILQPLDPKSDASLVSSSTESKPLSLGITVLPNKPVCPPVVSTAPSSFNQPLLPVTTLKTPDTTPSPSSTLALTPGSDKGQSMYHLGYTNQTSNLPPCNDPSPPAYNLSFPISGTGISPKEPTSAFHMGYPSSSVGLTPTEPAQSIYTTGYPAVNMESSPPPYPKNFPSSSSTLVPNEPAPPMYHMAYALDHQNPTPAYMNLPDPPPYSAAMSVAASEKHPTAGIQPIPIKDGFNLIPVDPSPPKFSPGIIPLSVSDPTYFPVNQGDRIEGTLQEATEVFTPPLAFADNTVVAEIPANRVQTMQSSVVPKSTTSDVKYLDVTDSTHEEDAQIEKKKEKDPEGVVKGKKKHHKVNVKNHKEKLHPELENIRSHAMSFPLITALCNDTSLMHTNSVSSGGSYDISTMKSSNSHPSGSSLDADSRRWSACCPSDTGTMLTMPTIRPKSWHSEHFDLDAAQRQGGHGFLFVNSFENHRSVPQNLYECRQSSPTPQITTWTNPIATGDYMGLMEKYQPEFISQQHMIPAKLNSGGHSMTDDVGMNTLKETYGMA
ncbi:uncharacterized protein LOC126820377 [Patella vulgata]|uniref:uncharacterized protein LOC126820377 n=1 Tax=Patella vulgata TaxID=6465 RepID=UPI00217F99C9|nr:uncharacterized protein LOC126820377 [Patella vulgata]